MAPTASIQKIEFADLLQAKQRFFTADNATVVISGKFDADLAYRAGRRFLGSWLKSDKLVPSTFRQPDDPLAAVEMTESPAPDRFEVRYITRGTARGSTDVAAFAVVAKVIENRLRAMLPDRSSGEIRVTSQPHTLPGTFMIALSGTKDVSRPKIEANDLMTKVLGVAITATELEAARQSVSGGETSAVDRWLDVDTFKIPPPNASNATGSVSIADARQRMLEKIQKQPFATVVMSPVEAARLRTLRSLALTSYK